VLSLISFLKKYIASVAVDECTNPETRSFVTVKRSLNDPLPVAKLQFFLSVGRQLQPCLIKYHSNAPQY